MPVRDDMKNPGSFSYAVPTRKLERPMQMVHCNGWIERDYAYLLEFDPMVLSYEEQPCKISYIFEKKNRWYTPDFAVYWRHQSPSLVECKPVSKLHKPENLQKWTAARMWCEQNHFTFVVVTDAALHERACLIANLKLLAGHGHQHITPQAREYLLRTLQNADRALSIEELVKCVVERTPKLNPHIVSSCVLHLLYTRELATDLSKPLDTLTTLVWFPRK
jgi:hypothetical protein